MIYVANGKLKVHFHKIFTKTNAMESIGKNIIFSVVWMVQIFSKNKQYCSHFDANQWKAQTKVL